MTAIVLFDGVCTLCNASVNFVIDRDPDTRFRFCSQQSPTGQALMREHRIAVPTEPESIILIEDGRVYQRSTAALRIARKLRGGWRALYAFILVPAVVRDLVYGVVAKNRYRWFGQEQACRLPSPELRRHFVEDSLG